MKAMVCHGLGDIRMDDVPEPTIQAPMVQAPMVQTTNTPTTNHKPPRTKNQSVCDSLN